MRAAHRLSARITTNSSSRRPARNRPVSSSHCARADNTGPNGIRLPQNDIDVQTAGSQRGQRFFDTGELRLHQQQGAAVGQQLRRCGAQRIEHQPAVVPASHAQAGPTPAGIDSASLSGVTGTYGGFDTTTSNGPQSNASDSDPSRTSTWTPAALALAREHCTARGQMSKAVTSAAPNCAAAMASTPLPVHKSSTRRPSAIAVRCSIVDEKSRIVLRRVHTDIGDDRLTRVGKGDRHRMLASAGRRTAVMLAFRRRCRGMSGYLMPPVI